MRQRKSSHADRHESCLIAWLAPGGLVIFRGAWLAGEELGIPVTTWEILLEVACDAELGDPLPEHNRLAFALKFQGRITCLIGYTSQAIYHSSRFCYGESRFGRSRFGRSR